MLNKEKLIACKYVNNYGFLANKKYPDNPNGSIDDIAAITNSRGNVLAMMPILKELCIIIISLIG